jgi:hypothetical protein
VKRKREKIISAQAPDLSLIFIERARVPGDKKRGWEKNRGGIYIYMVLALG